MKRGKSIESTEKEKQKKRELEVKLQRSLSKTHNTDKRKPLAEKNSRRGNTESTGSMRQKKTQTFSEFMIDFNNRFNEGIK